MSYAHVSGISAELVVASFNNYFCIIGKEITNTCRDVALDTLPDRVINSFGYVEITAAEIVTVVNTMPCKHSTGCDEVSSFILKQCIEILCVPLEIIFNRALYTATHPDLLKLAKVVPIHKNGDRNLPENYRPISVLSAINTAFEKLIAKRVMNFVERESLLTPSQHGFRSKRSTATAILSFSDIVKTYLNNNMIVLGLFIDIKKAFDTVHHGILLQKLERYGFRGVCLEFFRSYLTNRQQKVRFLDVESDFSEVSTGVPQGSVLGPILFYYT